VRRGTIVERLQKTLGSEEMLRLFPSWLALVLEEGMWRSFCNTGTYEPYEWTEFDAFVKAKQPRGLGFKGGEKQLREECRFYAEQGDEDAVKALAALDGMLPAQGKHGGKRAKDGQVGNTNLTGSTRTYSLARLKRDRPDLAALVIAGKMSAHAAAIEAGFRGRTVQHAGSVEGFLRAALRHLTPAQRAELRERL